jgi:hypothetical protein
MSDSPFGFERVQPKQTKFQVATLSSAVVFMVYHKKPNLMLEK